MGRPPKARPSASAELEQVLLRLDQDVIAWLDAEAARRERSRAWMVNHVCKMYRRNLEAARKRRERKRRV